MATRSTIAIRRKDGSVRSVYCHFDGYLDGVGATLLDWHNTEEQVEALIAGGDMSSLGISLETTGYYKSRGEDTPASDHADLAAYVGSIDSVFHEYNYLFEDGAWKWCRGKEAGQFKKLRKQRRRKTA